VIWLGNYALLPTQNTISRVGKFESRVGKVNKNRRCRAEPFLAHPFQKSCRRPCMLYRPLLICIRRSALVNFVKLTYGISGFNESIKLPEACIDTSCDSGTSTLETCYSNFIARQLYAQNSPKLRKIQYWHTGEW